MSQTISPPPPLITTTIRPMTLPSGTTTLPEIVTARSRSSVGNRLTLVTSPQLKSGRHGGGHTTQMLAATLAPNQYVSARHGSILSHGMILKSDHIPLTPIDALDTHISGAPNYQHIRPLNIIGVGQPSVNGIRTVLNVGRVKHSHSRTVVWLCLREEPVLYLNNRPFVLREFEYPFRNMNDFSGISQTRIDSIERRLKDDILDEGRANEGNVLVHDEVQVNIVRPVWDSVDQSIVQTSRNVFESLKSEGYNVEFVRIPVTAESVMDAKQVDALVTAYVSAYEPRGSTPIIVINDQLGRGRTALGMTITFLLDCHRRNVLDTLTPIHDGRSSALITNANDRNGLNELRRGEWALILKLVRMLHNGLDAKRCADIAIDQCGRVHHIRHAILQAYQNSEHAQTEQWQNVLSESCLSSMRRYFTIICFASWLMDAPQPLIPSWCEKNSFSSYMNNHTELTKLANSTVDEVAFTDLTNALNEGDENESEECDMLDQFVFRRRGAVLSRHTIIKSEHVRPPPPSSENRMQRRLSESQAAPVHHVPNLPLSSTAQPNARDIRVIINRLLYSNENHTNHNSVNASSNNLNNNNQSSRRLIWINLREEPVVFIHELPYLLRDWYHPFRVLTEFCIGVTPTRCETVEDRMRADIVDEWKMSGENQHILVHDDVNERLVPRWLQVEDPSEVTTTATIMASMSDAVSYYRIPLQVEEVPSADAFDRLFATFSEHSILNEQGETQTHVIFMDQNGSRRSTIGLVIACLILIYQGRLQFDIVDDDENVHDVVVSPQTPTAFTPRSTVVSVSQHDGGTPPTLALQRGTSTITMNSSDRRQTRHKYGRGEYKGILSLIRVLRHGRTVKEEVDLCIDACAADLNIRDAIVNARQNSDIDRKGNLTEKDRAVKYLESYAMLIAFNAYLHARKEAETRAVAGTLMSPMSPPLAENKIKVHFNDVDETVSSSASELSSPRGDTTAGSDAAQMKDYNQFNPYIDKNNNTTATSAAINGNNAAIPAESPRDEPDQRNGSALDTTAISTASSSTYEPTCVEFLSFSSWLDNRAEVKLAISHLRAESEESLKINVIAIDDEFASAYDHRNGNVLVRGSLLKSDYFIGVLNKNIQQIVDGAVNFRPIDDFPIAGTGIPKSTGMDEIISFWTSEIPPRNEVDIKRPFRAKSIVWFNLREEPLLYINQRPFVLRDGDVPYTNLENTGITPKRVELMEKQLKRDILAELQQSGDAQRIMLHDENKEGSLYAYWEHVKPENISTAREEFESRFRAAGVTAYYYRTPITDEQAPSPLALDAMIAALQTHNVNSDRVIIANCQMGRGRTTTALIIACAWCVHTGQIRAATWERIKQNHLLNSHDPIPTPDRQLVNLSMGWFRVITALVRVLPDGAIVKQEMDAIIDHCGAMQNLRTVIAEQQQLALEALPRKRSAFIRRGTNYLIRYFILIAINAYLRDQVNDHYKKKFSEWLNERSEIMSILTKVVFPDITKSSSASSPFPLEQTTVRDFEGSPPTNNSNIISSTASE